ncbi:MAG: TonB family protein [Tepidimonas sp.]|uniref:energy transducer TonB n=1 Tax=Tepidimonas sp. TaxID=2002775 RepID=UPI00259F2806|nr:TonB family protein [Tepidimonas sp.]MDM7457573.1 TonB family protein [Tepidimonas sp.]
MVLPRALASLSARFRADPLPWALALSVTVHAAVLTVRFAPPLRPERVLQDTPLEVILVNARGERAPERPQAIAQANLAGGGQARAARATSPLSPAMQMQAGDALDDEEQRIEAMKARQSQLLAQLRQEIARLSAPEAADASDAQAREQRRQALLKTLAEIEKRINEENARPRKRYISPATREEIYALYYDELRRRIEDRGTAQFPEQGGRKLYGELTMAITVNHDGRVLDTEVVQGSGIPPLDSRAQAIVRSLQFARFSQAMRQRADQIVVVSRFRFTRDAGLQTQISDTH